MKQTIIIAMPENNSVLSSALKTKYESNGDLVITSSETNKDSIKEFFASLENEKKQITKMIYISPELFEASILDNDFTEKVFKRIDDDLAVGTWWIQNTASHMSRLNIEGNIILINHITSMVPVQKYSYAATSQAALLNLSKVAILDLTGDGHKIQINSVSVGWQEANSDESQFLDKLNTVYGNEPSPIRKVIKTESIVEACYMLGNLQDVNGVNINVDGGYWISRNIRQFD